MQNILKLLFLICCVTCQSVHASQSTIAATLDIQDMFAEGITRNNQTGDFFLGSLYRGEIWTISPQGKARKFNKQHTPLWSIFGLKIDAKNNLLWAVANPGSINDSNWGSSAVMAFDLDSGELLIHRILKGIPGEHLLNDLAIAADGKVYITDTNQGSVYSFDKKDGFKMVLKTNSLRYPNGIVLLPDSKHLLIAAGGGLHRLDLVSGALNNLKSDHGRLVGGFDGLSLFNNRLIAVQNGTEKSRIISMTFDSDYTRVKTAKVLDENHPVLDVATTGTVDGNKFFYIANSQLDNFDDKKGKIRDKNKLQPTYILQVNLFE